jgi:hypothetical protein
MNRPCEALVLFVVMAKKANSAVRLGTEEMRIREETRKDGAQKTSTVLSGR